MSWTADNRSITRRTCRWRRWRWSTGDLQWGQTPSGARRWWCKTEEKTKLLISAYEWALYISNLACMKNIMHHHHASWISEEDAKFYITLLTQLANQEMLNVFGFLIFNHRMQGSCWIAAGVSVQSNFSKSRTSFSSYEHPNSNRLEEN